MRSASCSCWPDLSVEKSVEWKILAQHMQVIISREGSQHHLGRLGRWLCESEGNAKVRKLWEQEQQEDDCSLSIQLIHGLGAQVEPLAQFHQAACLPRAPTFLLK